MSEKNLKTVQHSDETSSSVEAKMKKLEGARELLNDEIDQVAGGPGGDGVGNPFHPSDKEWQE